MSVLVEQSVISAMTVTQVPEEEISSIRRPVDELLLPHAKPSFRWCFCFVLYAVTCLLLRLQQNVALNVSCPRERFVPSRTSSGAEILRVGSQWKKRSLVFGLKTDPDKE